MSLWRTFKIAWEGLTLNKARSFLTTLGVIIGVGAVIVMMAVSAGAEAEIADQINTLGANLIIVVAEFSRGGFSDGPREPPGLYYDDLDAIAQNVTGINGISAEQSTTQDVSGGGTTLESVSVVGTTPGLVTVREYVVAEGRFLTDEDNDRTNKVAVLGYEAAQELYGEGSNPVGQTIKIGSNRFTVVGVMAEKGVVGNTDYDSRIYIPITVVFKKFAYVRLSSEKVRSIEVSAASEEWMGSVMAQIEALLIERHDVDPTSLDFSLVTQDNIINTVASTTETFRNLLSWVAGVSLVVGGIGIMNIMLVSVTERTREIGLRQALGARPRDVQLQFLLEAVMLSLIGGLVGVAVGAGGSYIFDALGTMRTELVWSSIPLSFGAAAVVGIFFGYYPATKAAQLDPIEALRRE
jgi:putative ABC transport system permease protein